MPHPRFHLQFAWLPILLVLITAIALVVGAVALHYVEAGLMANTGDTLALAAVDIADKLDRVLFERYVDIRTLAETPLLQGNNVEAISKYLAAAQMSNPVYLWIAVVGENGRITAASNSASIGQDRSGRPWFQAVRGGEPIHVRDAEPSPEAGGVMAVTFAAPLHGANGEFRGAVIAQVGLPVLEDVFTRTARVLERPRGVSTHVEWQFLNRRGEVILDSVLRQEATVNLIQIGLPSAILGVQGESGYIEERHLRRKIAVVTGYAKTGGYGRFTGLEWIVLVRMDRSEVLAPVGAILWKLGLAGAVLWTPLFGLLLWSVLRLRREWVQARESEATISESENRFKSAFEESAIGMTLLDPGGRFLRVNRAFCAMVGYAEDELLARTFHDITHQDDVEPSRAVAERLLADKTSSVHLEKRYLHKTGRTIWVHVNVSLVRDVRGVPRYFITQAPDITERKRAEEQLRASEERFRKIFDDAPIGMATVAAEYRLTKVNKALCNLLGYAEDELTGKTFLDITHPDDQQLGLDLVQRLYAGDIPSFELQKRYLRKDGAVILAHLTVTSIRDSEGRHLHNLAMIEDLSERKLVESRQAAQVAVSLALAESATLAEAALRILQNICETMGWEFGAIWYVGPDAAALRCENLWHSPALEADEFAALSLATTFSSGVGLPGRVWASGEPAWIADVVKDPNFPRAAAAATVGLHGAFGFPVKSRDRTLGVIEFFSREIREPDQGLLTMMADIGLKIGAFVERTHLEQERKQLGRSLQLLLDSTGEGIYGVDAEERCTFVNKAAATMFGYEPAELLGQSLHALTHHSRADGSPYPEADCPTREVFRSGRSCYVTDDVFWRRNGSSFPVEYTANPIRERGVRKGAVVTFLDVTERRRVAAAAQASEARFRLAIDSASDAILYLDGTHVIVWANHQASVITGQPLEGLVGRSLMAAFATQPLAKAQLSSIGVGKPVPPLVEFEVFLPDGTAKWLEVTVTHVWKDAEVAGWLLVARDRTERRQIERQLRQSEKMAALGMLLDGVAHELNNPLFMISGFSQLADEKAKSGHYETLGGDLAAIREAAKRATDILQRTLLVARHTKSGNERCEVNRVVQQTLDLAADDLTRGRIVLHRDFQADLPPVLANPQELSQVFLNLITNACKAMAAARGQGTLRVATRFAPDRSRSWAEVRVADDGPGIGLELRARIFEPFSTAQRGSQGTGLSLAICHRIVTDLGGTLTLESREGHGATFIVRVPALKTPGP